MDFTLYWFMFPVSIGVATCAMLSGIGGAALFTPIFVLIFPLLGPEYELQTTVAAIGTALLTETFGFTSGFIGYLRKKTIDFALAWRFLRVSVPIGIVGAFLAHFIPEGLLILGYALLVAALAYSLLYLHQKTAARIKDAQEHYHGAERIRIDHVGREYSYPDVHLGVRGSIYTGIGAFLTGMVSVGIGEVVISQLTRRGVPVAIAASTSVAIVIVTVAFASFTLIGQLIDEGGMSAVPWNLVCYSIPGVLIGGQIGPRLQGKISQTTMEHAIGWLFVILAVAMSIVAVQKLGLV
ncbi:MAG: sulfite exporter TauE/SafE family protein [Woeseiaceae bacterium]|nr:sulfite exporter TauE/SafE family protein [Woeseiaceae bacterium]